MALTLKSTAVTMKLITQKDPSDSSKDKLASVSIGALNVSKYNDDKALNIISELESGIFLYPYSYSVRTQKFIW